MVEEERKNEDLNREDSEDDEGDFFEEDGVSEDKKRESLNDEGDFNEKKEIVSNDLEVEDIVNESNLDNVENSLIKKGIIVEEKSDKKGDEINKKIEKKQNRQVMWAVVLMISLIVIILGVPFVTKNYINKFNAYGLEFKKTRLGDLIFYSTKFPTINTVTGQIIGEYPINLRSDPRELDYIEIVDIPNNTITFMKDLRGFYAPVYLSLDSNLEVCEDSGIALMNLAGFLRGSNLEVRSAVTNATYAKEKGIEFASCLEKPSNTVIRFHNANKTAIYKTMKNCYDIVFKDCEIIPVTEKFQLIILKEYMSHFRE